MKKWEIVIITGMSGAGKTMTIDYFEDHGYFCIDNLPARLLHSFVTLYCESEIREKKLAFIIDMRSFSSASEFLDELKRFEHPEISTTLLFLDCKVEELIKRYTLTRRTHPIKEGDNLLEKIEWERSKLLPIKDIANVVIDTSGLKAKAFLEKLEEQFKHPTEKKLKISFTSFGFKNGIPLDVDMMFDVRCLPNPYYVPELTFQTGKDLAVREFVLAAKESRELLEKITDLLIFTLPLMEKEGKAYFNIGIGCSGGKHRSVTFAYELSQRFLQRGEYSVVVSHRDVAKE